MASGLTLSLRRYPLCVYCVGIHCAYIVRTFYQQNLDGACRGGVKTRVKIVINFHPIFYSDGAKRGDSRQFYSSPRTRRNH